MPVVSRLCICCLPGAEAKAMEQIRQTVSAQMRFKPFFHSTDRSMTTNYMRPGFTQGIWANGELFPGFNYIAMLGNSLNTLDISANKIDNRFAYATAGDVRYFFRFPLSRPGMSHSFTVLS